MSTVITNGISRFTFSQPRSLCTSELHVQYLLKFVSYAAFLRGIKSRALKIQLVQIVGMDINGNIKPRGTVLLSR